MISETRTLSSSTLRLVYALFLVASTTSQAGTLSRSIEGLNAADREAMKRAQMDVLDQMNLNAVSVWKEETTGHSGKARLLRRFDQNGMVCFEVEQIVQNPGTSRYVLPFCRAGDGVWHLSF